MRLTALTTRLSELFNELNRMPKRQDELSQVGHEGTVIIASALYLMPLAVDSTPASIQAYAAKSKQDLVRFAQILGEQDRAMRIVREMIAVSMGEQPVPAHDEFDDDLDCELDGLEKELAELEFNERSSSDVVGMLFCSGWQVEFRNCHNCRSARAGGFEALGRSTSRRRHLGRMSIEGGPSPFAPSVRARRSRRRRNGLSRAGFERGETASDAELVGRSPRQL